MTRGNRRKRVRRSTGLLRLVRRRGNRRVKARTARKPPAPAAASEATGGDKPPRDWRGVGRKVGRAALQAAKIALVVAALGGTVLGGHYGYRRLVASTYFDVERIEIRGVRRLSASSLRRLLEPCRGRAIFRLEAAALERVLLKHPWVKKAHVERRLPDTIIADVVEHQPRASLLLGHLYLVDREGEVFKRAETTEADGLPVITGLDRQAYLRDPEVARRRTRQALAALEAYYQQVRPPLSEVHIGDDGELTLSLRRGGVALRFGSRFGAERLRKLDQVWAALGPRRGKVRAIYLDNEVHPERVVVRMAKHPSPRETDEERCNGC